MVIIESLPKTSQNQKQPTFKVYDMSQTKTKIPTVHDTDKTKLLVIELFAEKCANIAACCRSVDISRDTFYRWYNDDEAFRKSIDEEREALIDFAEEKLFTSIKKGNVIANIFFLKTKGKDRGYTEKSEIDHTSKGEAMNAPVSVVVHGSASKLLDGGTTFNIQL